MHTVPERVCPWEGKVKVRQLQGIVFQKARNALVDEMLAWGGAAKIGQETADMALRNGLKGASLAVKAMEESADKRPDPPLLKRAPKRPVLQPAVQLCRLQPSTALAPIMLLLRKLLTPPFWLRRVGPHVPGRAPRLQHAMTPR